MCRKGFWHREHQFWKKRKSVHDQSEWVFTFGQNRCSRSTRIGVHDGPEYALRAWVVIIVVLVSLGIGKLYVTDSSTVKQALVVQAYFKDYCRLHSRYPEREAVESRFPDLFTGREWYYWPNDTWTVASFQYPMTLPLFSAPGRSKLSEFIPVIYSYAVHHPCRGLIRKTVTMR